jgi:REP element-mobilizing transposase RayT
MRVEPIAVGSYMHALKRGGRGASIVDEEADKRRFLRSLYYLNDEFLDENWDRTFLSNYSSQTAVIRKEGELFYRPIEWPARKPLTKILCYILMPNHIHLLLKETQIGGISTFMKRLGQSMTNHFNKKYENKGSIFQGSYKRKVIDTDLYLRYLAVYIMVKNAFELYPKNQRSLSEKFEDKWKFAVEYPFSSLKYYVTDRNCPILDKGPISDSFDSVDELKFFSREVIESMAWKQDQDEKFNFLVMED